MHLLAELVKTAKSRGLGVILDAKRSDIASTFEAYCHFAFDVMEADIMTCVPYFGTGFMDVSRKYLERGHGFYMVWLSSNPGAEVYQLPIASKLIEGLRNKPYYEQCGLVLGATKIAELDAGLLADAQRFSLLLPGVGAQGAEVDLQFKQMIAKAKTALVPVSRGLTQPAKGSQAYRSWSDFEETISKNVARYNKQLSC